MAQAVNEINIEVEEVHKEPKKSAVFWKIFESSYFFE